MECLLQTGLRGYVISSRSASMIFPLSKRPRDTRPQSVKEPRDASKGRDPSTVNPKPATCCCGPALRFACAGLRHSFPLETRWLVGRTPSLPVVSEPCVAGNGSEWVPGGHSRVAANELELGGLTEHYDRQGVRRQSNRVVSSLHGGLAVSTPYACEQARSATSKKWQRHFFDTLRPRDTRPCRGNLRSFVIVCPQSDPRCTARGRRRGTASG